jgi:hypothetical protein
MQDVEEMMGDRKQRSEDQSGVECSSPLVRSLVRTKGPVLKRMIEQP